MNNAITTFGKLGYDHIYKFNHLPELRSRTIEQKFLIEHKDLLYKSLGKLANLDRTKYLR